MAWIRLSDDYVDDEKFFNLSDGAFRLWHEAMAYCRRYQTDGLIPFGIMKSRRSYTKGREKQLASGAREGLAALWILVPGMGYRVNKYLDWNLSKEEENNERSGSAARMRKFRNRGYGVTPTVTSGVTNGVTPPVTNAFVPDRTGLSRSSKEEKAVALVQQSHVEETGAEAVIAKVAAAFCERYSQIYAEERHGARYPVREARDFPTFMALAKTWPDSQRLEDMFRVFLHLPGKNALNAQGTPAQFLHHASECDALLRKNGR